MVDLDEGLAGVASLDGLDVDALVEKVFVLVERIVGGGEPVMWWSYIFLEACEFLGFFHVVGHHLGEVSLRESAVLGDPVIHWCWLIVPQVLEGSHMGMAEEEWHISVSIVDSTELSAFKE